MSDVATVFTALGVLCCMLLPALITFVLGIYVGYNGRLEQEREEENRSS